MKRINLFFLLLLFSWAACKSNDKENSTAENDVDAARNFVRAALDGKFNEARKFMLPDSVNQNYMDIAERSFQRLDPDSRIGYLNASIRIIDANNKPDDSTSIIIYSNSFKNDPDTLKLLKIEGQWLVDFKYLYLHHADTVHPKELPTEKIK